MRPRPPKAGAVVAAASALLLLGGCGNGDAEGDDGPDKATVACRAEWKDLGHQVRGNDEKTNPSALAARWNTVVATVDYYESTATASDCEKTLEDQKAAIAALTAFADKLAPYDMELKVAQVRDAAEAYAAGPRPSPSAAPSPKSSESPGGKDKKKQQKQQKPPPLPPAPTTVAAALKSLTAKAPLATQQQGPGWQQARVVELTDPAAVTKAVKDLAFLSTQSPAWRSCTASLALVRRALAAAG